MIEMNEHSERIKDAVDKLTNFMDKEFSLNLIELVGVIISLIYLISKNSPSLSVTETIIDLLSNEKEIFEPDVVDKLKIH